MPETQLRRIPTEKERDMTEAIRCATLENCSEALLYETFTAAFSDYAVPMQLSLQDFLAMHRRRGIDYRASCGAWADGRLVGFVFNGLGQWQGRLTAYDGGTGILPDQRGRGLSGQLVGYTREQLRRLGCRQWLLEVLVDNQKAIQTYRKSGFRPSRSFVCYGGSLPEASANRAASPPDIYIQDSLAHDALPDAAWLDWQPSWQNSDDSVARTGEELICLVARTSTGGQKVASLIATAAGSVFQLAVSPDWRRRGIGRRLLQALAERSPGRSLRYINLDTGDSAGSALMEACGLKVIARQFEMIADL